MWSGDHQKDVKSLFFEFETGLKKHYFSNMRYDRMPEGALIGATCETVKKLIFFVLVIVVILQMWKVEKEFPLR